MKELSRQHTPLTRQLIVLLQNAIRVGKHKEGDKNAIENGQKWKNVFVRCARREIYVNTCT